MIKRYGIYDHGYVPLVVNTSWSCPHPWFIAGFLTRVTRRLPLVEQEPLTLSGAPESTPCFSVVRVTRYNVFSFLCSVSHIVVYPFVLFPLVIVFSVLLFTDSDYLPLVSFGYCVVYPYNLPQKLPNKT